jgi:hypothetical protein
MVTEQNILDADMSRKTRKKGKREKKTIVRAAEQSAAEKKKKRNYCPYSRGGGVWGETWV